MNVGWDKGLDRLFLVWPLTIEHIIDENSPFWTLSAEDLRKERFELAVILEGIVESTGMTTQARTSYLVNEILWGHRFEKLITFQKEDGTYKIDYSRFDMTVPIDTPTCSAKELAELREQENFFYYASFNDSALSSFNTNELRKRKIDEKMETDELKPNESEIKMV
ncbi:G -activated inward rectifier potassium channel 3-like [Brachionus plicatilis]|uniref:G-activated inward rectifier potassium channel 3-like n=1 Tax=Brachionus plicatilis TaxID=10195 RepID=A0A3M7P2B5_BRAPC|nr:G -activated inward rectifier potassium channel 3-like [Brachionus plicatilis]